MKMPFKLLAVAGMFFPLVTLAGSSETRISKKLISLYEAQLVCPAAPQIGCGSAAKPILLQLERDPNVSEAWLNRAGTIMAVVWKRSPAPKDRAKLLQDVLPQQKVRELKGEAREQTLKGFLSASGWYRGAAVDRLSEEEAGIMAARLLRRMRELISLTDERANALEQGFTAVLTRKL